MNTKNWMSSAIKPVNRFFIQDLSVELVELSEKDLQDVVGGCCSKCCGCSCHRKGKKHLEPRKLPKWRIYDGGYSAFESDESLLMEDLPEDLSSELFIP